MEVFASACGEKINTHVWLNFCYRQNILFDSVVMSRLTKIVSKCLAVNDKCNPVV